LARAFRVCQRTLLRLSWVRLSDHSGVSIIGRYVALVALAPFLSQRRELFRANNPRIPRGVQASRRFDSLPPQQCARYLAGLTIYVAVTQRAPFFNLARKAYVEFDSAVDHVLDRDPRRADLRRALENSLEN
jgi:hypothetical protein